MSSCLIIAGEKSGEDHTLSFFDDLKSQVPDCHFFGVGGDALESRGVELMYHLRDFSSIGIAEIFNKIGFYFDALKKIENEVVKRSCKTAILVDFQDFNLRLARRLKKRGVNVLYYVAPQAWAWRPWRAATLGRCVHTLFTILPFEKEWFQTRGVERVKAVVHPLLQAHQKILDKQDLGLAKSPFYEDLNRPLNIVLLPGSRKHEIINLLPEIIDAAQRLKKEFNIKFSIVKSKSVDKGYYDLTPFKYDKVYSEEQLEEALIEADLSIATSGTVTLATALFELPTVAVYKASILTEMVFNLVSAYDGYKILPNIVHNKLIFPELVQEQAYGSLIYRKLKRWITKRDLYESVKKDLATTRHKLSGDDFVVSDYMAKVIK